MRELQEHYGTLGDIPRTGCGHCLKHCPRQIAPPARPPGVTNFIDEKRQG
ncbi:MAG: hypothetical protein LUG19_12835 [Desulfovibrio sp.]|nr:hypothetical protein [Desulfovibrio sp.]MCD7985117.1 hypothetical protein [Desulfovibrio sp.]